MSTVPTNPNPSHVERERSQAMDAWMLANSELCTILRPDWAETCVVFGNPGEGIEYINRTSYAPVTIVQEFYPAHGEWLPQPVAFVITGDQTEYSAVEASRLIAALSQAVSLAEPVDDEATVVDLCRVAMSIGVQPGELMATRSRSDAVSANAGSALRTLREIAGLTRKQAARRVECSRRFLRAVERGEQSGTPAFYGRVAAVCAEKMRRDALAGIS